MDELQRDLQAGLIAKALLTDGDQGVEYQVFGAVITDKEETCVWVDQDEEAIAWRVYQAYLSQKTVSVVKSLSKRCYAGESVASVLALLERELQQEKTEHYSYFSGKASHLQWSEAKEMLTGFIYQDADGCSRAFVNAYFPVTLERWLKANACSEIVSPLYTRPKEKDRPILAQLRAFEGALLAMEKHF